MFRSCSKILYPNKRHEPLCGSLRRISFTVIALTLSGWLTGCQKDSGPRADWRPERANTCSSLAEIDAPSTTREASVSPFEKNRFQTANAETDETTWIALIDNGCASRASEGRFSRALYDKRGLKTLSIQAYRLGSGEKRARKGIKDDCTLGVSLEQKKISSIGGRLRFPIPEPGEGLHDASVDAARPTQEHHEFLGSTTLVRNRSLIFTRGQEPIIAIVDTGVALAHPDLRESLWRGPGGEAGFDFSDYDNDPSDEQYHGTHVAGLAAAIDHSGRGISGVAPGAKIMAVRTMDSFGHSTIDRVANGILYAIENGADVINLSLGSPTRIISPILVDVMQRAARKNVVVVIAAGNDKREINSDYLVEPAALAHRIEGVISVGSVDTETGDRSLFSNFSSKYVEIMAPGAVHSDSVREKTVGLLSTFPFVDQPYARLPGTSMATPLVSGAAALVIAKFRARGRSYSNALVERELKRLSHVNRGLMSDVRGGRVLDLRSFHVDIPVHPEGPSSPQPSAPRPTEDNPCF